MLADLAFPSLLALLNGWMREKLHIFFFFNQISEMLNVIQVVKLNKLEGSLSPAKMILHYSDNA